MVVFAKAYDNSLSRTNQNQSSISTPPLTSQLDPLDILDKSQLAKITALIESTKERHNAFIVVPEKGTITVSHNNGDYKIKIMTVKNGDHDITLNKHGNLISINGTKIEDLPITTINSPTLQTIREILTQAPIKQAKPEAQTTMPDFTARDYQLDDAINNAINSNGHIDKNTLMAGALLAYQYQLGANRTLDAIIQTYNDMPPDAITQNLLLEANKKLLHTVMNIKVDPNEAIKSHRQHLQGAYEDINPELSLKLTDIYQDLTGSDTFTVVVTNQAIDSPCAIGDGNVIFPAVFYEELVDMYPDVDTQNKVIRNMLEHEFNHYKNNDIVSSYRLIAAAKLINTELESDHKEGVIDKETLATQKMALELLFRLRIRNDETRADGNQGLLPETAAFLDRYKKDNGFKIPDQSILIPWTTHPSDEARVK
jgi:hypothetical protein